MRGQFVEGVDERGDVVAVDPQRLPPERLPFVGDRFGAQDAFGGAVGLQGVDVDDGGQVVQVVVGGLQRCLPGGALVELAVGQQVEHPGRVALVAQPERHPGGHRQAVPQRAAGDLHTRGVGRHARHRQPGLVGAVGLQLLDRDGPGLGQRRVQGDGVVADGEQEPVPIRPVRVLGPESQLVGVGDGEDIGDAHRLADVALALNFSHRQRVEPDPVGGLPEPLDPLGLVGVGLLGRGLSGTQRSHRVLPVIVCGIVWIGVVGSVPAG